MSNVRQVMFQNRQNEKQNFNALFYFSFCLVSFIVYCSLEFSISLYIFVILCCLFSFYFLLYVFQFVFLSPFLFIVFCSLSQTLPFNERWKAFLQMSLDTLFGSEIFFVLFWWSVASTTFLRVKMKNTKH